MIGTFLSPGSDQHISSFLLFTHFRHLKLDDGPDEEGNPYLEDDDVDEDQKENQEEEEEEEDDDDELDELRERQRMEIAE